MTPATTTNKSATRTPPNLERAIQAAAEELLDDATTLADFSINLSRDLPRGQQYALLQRLVEIGRQMHRTIGQLCKASDNAACLGPRWWHVRQALTRPSTTSPERKEAVLPLFATLADRALELGAAPPIDAAAALALHSVAVAAGAALSQENIGTLTAAIRHGKIPRRRA